MKRSPGDARTRRRAAFSSNAQMSTRERPTVRVCYATGNAGKFAEASHVFKRAENVALVDVILSQVDVDTVEIQGTMEEITARKCEEATKILFSRDDPDHKRLQQALDADFGAGNGGDFLLVEDVSLGIDALNGFPGPYCKPMLEAIAPEGLWDLMSRYDNRRATVTCTLGVMDLKRGGAPKIFSGTISGTMVPPRGDVKHGKASWNSVFQPDGFSKTFGELQFEEQAQISHRRIALEKFIAANF